MGKRAGMPKTYEEMEQHFFDAIKRIKEGRVTCPALSIYAQQGKLTPSVSMVAMEAGSVVRGVWKGMSRSLIGHKNCRYANVYAAILNPRAPQTEEKEKHLAATKAYLQEEVQEWKGKYKLAVSEMAAMARRMESREREVQDKLDEVMRTQARAGRDFNTMPVESLAENVSTFRRRAKQ